MKRPDSAIPGCGQEAVTCEPTLYRDKLLSRLAEKLTEEFGRGFDERNLRNMRAFYSAYPIWDAVRSELNWTHNRDALKDSDHRPHVAQRGIKFNILLDLSHPLPSDRARASVISFSP